MQYVFLFTQITTKHSILLHKLFSKKTKFKHTGEFLVGFGLLFFGLSELKNAVPDVKSLLQSSDPHDLQMVREIQSTIETVYPGAKVQSYQVSEYEPGQPVLHAEAAAWTKKAGKNKEGGLNEKGRKSYERENPGSDLKAPSKKVGNPRRASFCARMKGMKKKLTSKKTANDPDSRINKSLRAWNC